MKRSEFLKKLGIGFGVAIIAPKVFADKDDVIYPRLADGVTIDTDLLPIKRSALEELSHMDISEPPYFKELRRKYPLTYRECDPPLITLIKDTHPSSCGGVVFIHTDSKYLRWNYAILIPARFTNKKKTQVFLCVPPKEGNRWTFFPLYANTKIKKTIPKGTQLFISGFFSRTKTE
jgi:hypothetical protein